MKIVFIGPPGAGKGTQCQFLAAHFAIPHIGTGEMLRRLQGAPAPLVHSKINRGHFAPDDFVLEMIGSRLVEPDCEPGYLLDGFPRTLVQAEAFDRSLEAQSQRVDHVIDLQVEPDELVRRLAERKRTGERSDDSAEFIRERFVIYADRTRPLLDYYDRQDLVRPVDGMGCPKEVFGNLLRAIGIDSG